VAYYVKVDSTVGVKQVTYKNPMALYAATSGGRLFDWMAQQLNAKSANPQITALTPKH